jgi:hypothetical protein
MLGMGLECGIPSDSPTWRSRSSRPASRRASGENGGVLTSPLSQRIGFGFGASGAVLITEFWDETVILSSRDRHTKRRAAMAEPRPARSPHGPS